MSAESDFEDTVKICEFYSDETLPFRVDYENRFILLGEYAIDPVTVDGELVCYMVDPPAGPALTVYDLDDFFQNELEDWEDRF